MNERVKRLAGEESTLKRFDCIWPRLETHADKFAQQATSATIRGSLAASVSRGWTVCRFHGARGGGPKGKRNGMYRHGLFTAQAMAQRRMVRELLRDCAEQLLENSEADAVKAASSEIQLIG
jgi:hypothetical protein